MKNNTHLFRCLFASSLLVSAAIVRAGCQSSKTTCCQKPEAAVAPATAPVAMAAPVPATPVAVAPVAEWSAGGPPAGLNDELAGEPPALRFVQSFGD